jgi:hypothetical protein
MKYFSLAFCLLFASISFSQTKPDTLTEKNRIEKQIFDSINAIPEVKERANYIEKETNGNRHIKIWIYHTPRGKGENYYWVKVGEDNGSNLVTHFNFIVYFNDFKIKYLDTVTNQIIDLKTWRQQRGMENH